MWQEIAIIIIAIAAFGKAGWSIYKFFANQKNSSPCDNCSGCQLKESTRDGKDRCEYNEKREKLKK